MQANCVSCGTKLEPADTFCQNCGTQVAAPQSPTTGSSTTSALSPESSVVGRIERAVYVRIARGFSWVLTVVALAGFFYSLVSALQSVGDLIGTQRSVSAAEVQASIANRRDGRGNQLSNEETVTDPRLVGEYETALAELVNLLPLDIRGQMGGDDGARNQLRSRISPLGKEIKERISVAKEAKGVLQSFPAKEMGVALLGFAELKQQKYEEAEMRKKAAEMKFLYLGGALMSTAILITLVSMILVLLAVERNTRVGK